MPSIAACGELCTEENCLSNTGRSYKAVKKSCGGGIARSGHLINLHGRMLHFLPYGPKSTASKQRQTRREALERRGLEPLA